MNRRIVLVMSVVGLFTAGTHGAIPGPASAQSLHDALAMAYQNNPRIESQRARVRSVDELVNQALTNWRPRLVIEGHGGASSTASTGLGMSAGSSKTTSNTEPRGAEIAVDQNLYREIGRASCRERG